MNLFCLVFSQHLCVLVTCEVTVIHLIKCFNPVTTSTWRKQNIWYDETMYWSFWNNLKTSHQLNLLVSFSKMARCFLRRAIVSSACLAFSFSVAKTLLDILHKKKECWMNMAFLFLFLSCFSCLKSSKRFHVNLFYPWLSSAIAILCI